MHDIYQFSKVYLPLKTWSQVRCYKLEGLGESAKSRTQKYVRWKCCRLLKHYLREQIILMVCQRNYFETQDKWKSEKMSWVQSKWFGLETGAFEFFDWTIQKTSPCINRSHCLRKSQVQAKIMKEICDRWKRVSTWRNSSVLWAGPCGTLVKGMCLLANYWSRPHISRDWIWYCQFLSLVKGWYLLTGPK